MSELDKIIYVGNKNYLLWAETNGHGYDYMLYPLGSRYDNEDYKIPKEIERRIIENANENYPIMIIDGYSIDGMLDEFALGKHHIRKSWGDVPRQIINGSDKSTTKFIQLYVKKESIEA